jgi:Na+/melibiose symporter-like transporter
LLALSALYCLAPLAMKLVAIALVWGFPIDARTQAALRARIAARAAAAAAAA